MTMDQTKMTQTEAEHLILEFKEMLTRLKEQMLQMEFRLPKELFDEEKRVALAAVVRESLLEMAKEKIPEELRNQYPELAKKLEEAMRVLLPEEH